MYVCLCVTLNIQLNVTLSTTGHSVIHKSCEFRGNSHTRETVDLLVLFTVLKLQLL